MEFRTDLALEIKEINSISNNDGIESHEETSGNISISYIKVLNSKGEQKMNKPKGDYITITCPPFSSSVEVAEEEVILIADKLDSLMPQKRKLALVVGLGNRSITPDALGPQVIEKILATRHISEEIKRSAGLEQLKAVAALSPGVLGQTGVETAEIINSVVKEIKPDVVIVIDALASKSLDRLGTTIQISNTGISPGSGVLNKRKEISEACLGVPVIAIGIPTVVDGVTLVNDLVRPITDKEADNLEKKIKPRGASMMVTPREIDLIIERSAKVVSMAINKALQPDLGLEDIEFLVS